MLLGGFVARDGVLLHVEAEGGIDGRLLWESIPADLSDGLLAAAPPAKLTYIGEDDTCGIFGVGLEGLDVFDHVDG